MELSIELELDLEVCERFESLESLERRRGEVTEGKYQHWRVLFLCLFLFFSLILFFYRFLFRIYLLRSREEEEKGEVGRNSKNFGDES